MGDVGMALEIASCWQNDRYFLMSDGEASSAVLWDVELESKDAADQFQSAALDRISAMAGLPQLAKLGETAVTPGKRHLRIARPSPNRVRFLNTATPAMAVKFD